MADIAIFRINYKSDFILTLNSDAGWAIPFCIKFWTGAPSQAYFVGYDGTNYTHCAPVDGEPTKLVVQFDDHHLPIGDLKFQIGYHFTVADFPTSVEDEVLNQASVIIEVDDAPAQVMLDLNGETAPEIEFSLPAYANEAQRIANEQARIAAETQRISNEESRIAAETVRQQNETQRISREQARQNNEAQRIEREQARQANESQRIEREQARQTNEAERIEREQSRQTNEAERIEREQIRQEHEAQRIANETERKNEFSEIKTEAVAATNAANAAASLANEKAVYAKAQGDYAKEQGTIAEEDHQRAESDHAQASVDHQRAGIDHTQAGSDHTIATSDHEQATTDHTRAESDHTRAGQDHTQAVTDHTTATSDHTQAVNDHTRAESDHTMAESDHAAVEVYVDSLGAFDISAYHATGGVLAKYADLAAALGTNGANIPDALRKGGMSVKFVQSSDNNYVQYRYMSLITADADFTNVANWQGVEDDVVPYSKDLLSGDGAYNGIKDIIYDKFRTHKKDETRNFVLSSTKWGAEKSNATYIYNNIKKGDIIKIEARSDRSAYFALVNSVPNNEDIVAGSTPLDLIDEMTEIVTVTAGTTMNYVVPRNSILLVYNKNASATPYLPTSLTISTKNRIVDEIGEEPNFNEIPNVMAIKSEIDKKVDDNNVIQGGIHYSSTYEISGTRGKQFNSEGALVDSGNNNRRVCEVPVESFIIDISNGTNRPSICFYDNNMNLDTGTGLISSITLSTIFTYGLKVTPPAETAHVIVSCIAESGSSSYFGWNIYPIVTMNNNDIMQYLYNGNTCYVAPNGNDSNTGTIDSPFATFQHAIDSGFTNILGIDGNYGCQKINIYNRKNVSIKCVASGTRTPYYDNHIRMGRIVLDNSVDVGDVVLDTTTGLYTFTKTFGTDSNWHKVFITQEKPLVRDGLRSTSYWAILWEMGENISSHKKLAPVLSISDCQATSGTFFYDGSTVYIHPSDNDISLLSYKYLYDESDFNFINITDSDNIYIEGIDVYFGTDTLIYHNNCIGNNTIKDCDLGFCAYQTNQKPQSTNIDCYNCVSFKSCGDGFAPITNGNCNYYNCHGMYNYDDGVSHHDGTTGEIVGGIWNNNGKAGVAPSYGSFVNVLNVCCINNRYGLYLVGDSTRKTDKSVLISNCTFSDNDTKDILVQRYNPIITGCIYKTSSTTSGSILIGNTILT